jgi:hypothetical protein
MNYVEAKRLAEAATNEQLRETLANAKTAIKDWNVRSTVNKGLSKGAVFNVLSHGDLFRGKRMHILAATNILREFGEFFPGYKKPGKKEYGPFHHEEPRE